MKEALPPVKLATWGAQEPEIRFVRTQVFVDEQGIPEALDFDGKDADCLHALVTAPQGPIATGRMTPDGHIGRLAVLKAWRDRGLGTAILRFFVALAQERGLARVHLNAQQPAVDFYRRLGFVLRGEPFLEAGIPHIRMERSTKP